MNPQVRASVQPVCAPGQTRTDTGRILSLIESLDQDSTSGNGVRPVHEPGSPGPPGCGSWTRPWANDQASGQAVYAGTDPVSGRRKCKPHERDGDSLHGRRASPWPSLVSLLYQFRTVYEALMWRLDGLDHATRGPRATDFFRPARRSRQVFDTP
jgi:hypothetical protein